MGNPPGQFFIGLQQLEHWFTRQKRALPWREDPSIYRVWVSEIMLQQTQVAAVVPYFEKFIARFPTVRDLAQSTEQDVLLHWAGLGYYSRARNLRKGAQLIVGNAPSGGQNFPLTREGWLAIPGVGHYTAGAILSIALDRVEPILDGNVERVLSRVRRVDRAQGDSVFKSRLWRLAQAFVTRADQQGIRPSVLNQALMELGATVCTPKSPRCVQCPLQGLCRAYATETVALYPPRRARKEWIEVAESLVCLVRAREGRVGPQVLLRLRSLEEWRSGLWDLLEAVPEPFRLTACDSGEELVTRHIVTRHRIQRRTRIQTLPRVQGKASVDAWSSSGSYRWVSLEAPEVPLGSAAKKTFVEVRKWAQEWNPS